MRLVFVLLSILCFSCSEQSTSLQSESSSFTLKFPAASADKKYKIKNLSSSAYAEGALASLDEINCYAVLISWGGVGKCYDGANAILASASISYGAVAAGSELIINNVPSGSNREISIIGFYSNNSNCPNFQALTFSDYQTISQPMVVSSLTTTLVPGEQQVTMALEYDINKSITYCKGVPFNWQLGGVFDLAKWDQAIWGP